MKKALVILLLLLPMSLLAESAEELHLIYIGNSGITYQQMHRTVEDISSRVGFSGPRLVGHPLCRGGSNFGYHVTNLKNIRKLVESEGCTIAVITGTMTFIKKDAVELISSLQEMGLDVYLLLQAESRTQNRNVQNRCGTEHRQLADETGAVLIPLGTAVWDILTDVDPAYDFFAHDKSHASKKAAYMGACMIVNLITGLPVLPPPEDYVFTYSGMSAEDEVFLRESALKYTLNE